MAKKTFNEVYKRLVDAVYSDDLNSQRYYMSMVEDHRHIPVDYLLERGCLFIPNNDYIRYYLGEEANTFGCELYQDEKCLWTLYLLLPVMDLAGDVVGLTGWDAQHKYQEITEGTWGLSMYKVSSKNVFQREKYFLSDIPLLKRTFDKRVIFITDGVFDSVTLNYRGIPALALLGSTFSPENLYFLRWYKRIYVCADNDAAGLKLYNMLKKAVPGVHRVIQGQTKDIEEFLRQDGKDGPITQQLLNAVNNDIGGDIILK